VQVSGERLQDHQRMAGGPVPVERLAQRRAVLARQVEQRVERRQAAVGLRRPAQQVGASVHGGQQLLERSAQRWIVGQRVEIAANGTLEAPSGVPMEESSRHVSSRGPRTRPDRPAPSRRHSETRPVLTRAIRRRSENGQGR
jgi:hypothetical protein